ncbi:MAG: hypothetical protein U5R06_18125 [candidate division KSB1 bacterium]|nr:hypothetical protein [candidate division KSB1 bacterium]
MDLTDMNNGDRMVFSHDTYEKISRIVYELRVRLRAEICVFADVSGYPVEYNGDNPDFNVSELTAVAAGSFAASNEMSKIISETPAFEHIFHEGVPFNTYMCSVGEDYMMIIVFRKNIPVGLVRLLTHQAVDRLSRYLEGLKQENSKVARFLDDNFQKGLDDELDKALG